MAHRLSGAPLVSIPSIALFLVVTMPPNQDKTSNGKQIEQIIAHNYFVFYSCIESMHRPSS